MYYGRRDAASRPGLCPHCKAHANLDSYTTRLFFVVFFIPLIPLKRVRIIDQCSSCQKHWAANPDDYEKAKQKAVAGALEAYRDQPTMENALIAHGQLLTYHMYKEASTLREAALEQFPDSAELRETLGSHLDQMGKSADAVPLYEQAFQKNPDLPEVRHRLALCRQNENRLDEAYELLDFLRKPGAGTSFNLDRLQSLASAYQKQKNHERVLEICQHLLTETPALADQYPFRKLVSASEKALEKDTSLLPAKRLSVQSLLSSRQTSHAPWIRWAVLGGLASLVVAGSMIAINEHRRTHRTLHVINGFAQPMEVILDGGSPIVVTDRSIIPLAEGVHQISLNGPVKQQQQITLASNYWSRWAYSPAWIFNIANLASVYEETIRYAATPQPSSTRLLNESELIFVPHVDYLFEDPPQTLKVESKTSSVTKIHVGTLPPEPTSTFTELELNTDTATALTYAEGHLNRNPNQSPLLNLYSNYAQIAPEQAQRIHDFLKAGLWRSPISIIWHRWYSSLPSVASNEADLIHEYDEQLKKDPENAALIYLRGRLLDDRNERVKAFLLADQKNPELGWPAFGLAADAENRGAWEEAKPWCDKAEKTLRSDPSFRNLRHVVNIGSKNGNKLAYEYQESLKGQSLGEVFHSIEGMLDAWASQQRYDRARESLQDWIARIPGVNATSPIRSAFNPLVNYVCGDLEELKKLRDDPNAGGLPQHQFHALLAIGDPDAATKLDAFEPLMNDPRNLLSLTLAYYLTGNQAEANRWLDKSCERLEQYDKRSKFAVSLLKSDRPPTTEEMDRLSLGASENAVVLSILAQRFPSLKPEVKQRVERLNVSRLPPYLLLKAASEAP